MGFADSCIKLVLKCILTVSYSISINGVARELFKPTKSLKQEDPLSPLLFLVCSEVLSLLMNLEVWEWLFKGVKVSQKGPQISHLLFANDCVLFKEATIKGAQYFQKIDKSCSRQCVNTKKSTIYFSSNTVASIRDQVLLALRMRHSRNLKKYLCLPNVVGYSKKVLFQALKDRMKVRVDNWCSRFLSQGGKEVFINLVLQAIPTYVMACFLLPDSLCHDLEAIMAKFWWQKSQGKKGIHWCTWSKLRETKDNRGMGFQNISSFNIALFAKQGWRSQQNLDTLLSHVLKSKYYPNSDFTHVSLKRGASYTWLSIWSSKKVLQDEVS